jgi:hypothetical protein
MKKTLLALLAVFIAMGAYSQIAKDFMIEANTDLIKSDNDGYFEKAQTGVAVNYFLSRKFTATGGMEYWTDGNDLSIVMGARWYPVPDAFIRVRGLIGANDIAVGGGWAKPLNEDWRFEALADVYAEGHIAIRAGFSYIIRRK